MATQEERRNATQLAIVQAAFEAFEARGGPVVSLEEIAQAAGVTKGSVHYHFESRVGLLKAVASSLFDAIEERVTALSRSADSADRAMVYVRSMLAEMASPAGRVLFTVGDELLQLDQLEDIDPFAFLVERLARLGVPAPITVVAGALLQFGRQLAFGQDDASEIDRMVIELTLV